MRYLELTELLAIHERVIEETGGSTGIRDVGLIQAAIEKPKTALFGMEMYSTVHEKAAVLLEALANYHGFVDGNKRTSLVSTGIFLQENGYSLEAEQEQVVRFMLEVATKKRGVQEITGWLKGHSVRV